MKELIFQVDELEVKYPRDNVKIKFLISDDEYEIFSNLSNKDKQKFLLEEKYDNITFEGNLNILMDLDYKIINK